MKRFFTNRRHVVHAVHGLWVALLIGLASTVYVSSQNAVDAMQTTIRQWYEFEPGEKFELEGSRYFIKDVSKTEYYENVPSFLKRTDSSKNSIGFRFSWDRRGNNFVDFVPEKPTDIEGRVRQLGLWVWGGNYSHELLGLFRNNEGVRIPVNFGKLNYFGWKKKGANVPRRVSNRGGNANGEDYFYFERFRVLANPSGKVNNIYVFLDRMEAAEEYSFVRYDGSDIEDIIRGELGTGGVANDTKATTDAQPDAPAADTPAQ